MLATQKWSIRNRVRWFPESAITIPTLAHVPGVIPDKHSRYRTKLIAMSQSAPHAALKKPRVMFVSERERARLVHLGKGRVLFE